MHETFCFRPIKGHNLTMVKQRALPVQVWTQDLLFLFTRVCFSHLKQPNYFTVIKYLHDCRTVFIQITLLQWQHSADGRQLPCPQTTEEPAASVPESLLPHSPRCSHVSSPAAVHFWLTEFRSQKLKGVFLFCSDLGKMFPVLCLLDVFGIIQNSHLPSLKKEMPQVSINSRPFSSIARPTPTSRLTGCLSDRAMWSRRCRLRFKL